MIRGDEEEKREETRRDVRGSVVVNKYSREVSGGKERQGGELRIGSRCKSEEGRSEEEFC
jgi:hypothetical protein